MFLRNSGRRSTDDRADLALSIELWHRRRRWPLVLVSFEVRYYELLRFRIHCPSAGRCDCCITCQRERLRRYDSKRTCCAMHINSMAAAATAAAARTGPRAAIGRLAAAKPIGDVDSGRRITRWSADTDAAERPREPRVCDRAASSSRAASSGSRAMPSVVHRL